MSDFVLSIMRMDDNELLEFLIGEVEARAIDIYRANPITEREWEIIDKRTDKIETIKAELLRRMWCGAEESIGLGVSSVEIYVYMLQRVLMKFLMI